MCDQSQWQSAYKNKYEYTIYASKIDYQLWQEKLTYNAKIGLTLCLPLI